MTFCALLCLYCGSNRKRSALLVKVRVPAIYIYFLALEFDPLSFSRLNFGCMEIKIEIETSESTITII